MKLLRSFEIWPRLLSHASHFVSHEFMIRFCNLQLQTLPCWPTTAKTVYYECFDPHPAMDKFPKLHAIEVAKAYRSDGPDDWSSAK